ncbi:MAG: formylglycine-generating enzyme family protein [Myxococcales bacterium]|nr:MAG: formylglycine-generating enzyme family protein [Myxococcales bacterium]
MKRALSLATAAALVACGGETTLPPQGQILLYIDTDAPLAPAPGSPAEVGLPPALFDRLRIEVRDQEAPEGSPPLARRDFPLHRGYFQGAPESVGIVPERSGGRLQARARLYRSVNVRAGELAVSSTVDVVQELPPVPAEGIVRVLMELRMEDTGMPRSLPRAEPLDAAPRTSAVGSWSGAAQRPCSGEAGEGELCVPGGAFWMGDPALRDDGEVADAARERLVVVSPFFIDAHEVTVAELRAHADDIASAGAELPPEWSGSSAGISEDDFSTYTPGPSSSDPVDQQSALPVNGVSWHTARAYCRAVGKDLPSEVMFEFLASGRGREQEYVWGNDEPQWCDGSVVAARAGFGAYATFDGTCRPADSIGGPLPMGGGLRDRAQLAQGEVLDLAGNLSEWTLDWFNTENEGVWATSRVLTDPVADERGAAGERRTLRGGSWRGRYVQLRAATRLGREPEMVSRAVGFRCARRP